MNTLAFDTCFGSCSVAVTWPSPDGLRGAYRFERLERGHAERLMPMIAEAMSEAPFGFSDLDRIVVTTGPGTFTGQRVGIAAARALSLASGAPVGTLSSLAVMAYTAVHELQTEVSGKSLVVAVDARRGEIYFQRFAGPDWAPLGEAVLTTPQDAVLGLGSDEFIAVGSGGEMLEAAAGGLPVVARLSSLQPDVRFIPDGAVAPSSELPRPIYLRPPDAKPQNRASLGRVS